ncbi:hypothetical protein B0H16DRAFT_1490703 [Mycena metata]|uniref:Uncharacterized protein n=1 Tax=Mycena metata TaxID=1033252 RepID=A0AAD7P323_9AGAR|nr:hypothetical protein B0H16DRAFT_1490703 [Mycena metata]
MPWHVLPSPAVLVVIVHPTRLSRCILIFFYVFTIAFAFLRYSTLLALVSCYRRMLLAMFSLSSCIYCIITSPYELYC